MDLADRAVLDADPWFGGLPPERSGRLLAEARTRRMADGTRIYASGDAPNGLWAVLEGEIRLMGYPAPGMEYVALGLRPGSWFGEVSTIDAGPRPHDAVAYGSVRLLHVPMTAFVKIAAEMPLFYHDLGKLVCRHERIALDFISQVVTMPPRARLARLLLARTDEQNADLLLRQEDLASMLGVSRQTLNRHVSALAAIGAIAPSYGRICVMDRAALKVRANLKD